MRTRVFANQCIDCTVVLLDFQKPEEPIKISAVRKSFAWSGRLANPANIIANYLTVFREGLELLVPTPSIQDSAAADENQWKTFTHHLVVKACAIDIGQSLFHIFCAFDPLC